MPYAIDFLNPAPDFERDRITDVLLRHRRREDGEPGHRPRAERPAVAVVAAVGGDARHRCSERLHRRARRGLRSKLMDAGRRPGTALLRPGARADAASSRLRWPTRCASGSSRSAIACTVPFLRPFFLDRRRRSAHPRRAGDDCGARRARGRARRWRTPRLLAQLGAHRGGDAAGRHRSRLRARRAPPSRLDAFLLPDSLHFAEYNAESPAGPAYTQRLCELFDALDRSWRAFRERVRRVRYHRADRAAARGARSPATASGAARRRPPTDRHRRLARGADLDASSRSCGRLRGARRPDGRLRSRAS